MTPAPTPADIPAMEQKIRTALEKQQHDVAEALCRDMLVQGGQLHVWRWLVLALRQQSKAQEALPILEMLVEQLPGNLDVRFDLAEVLLLLGEFGRGWREYKYRYSLGHTTHMDRKVQKPLWDGRLLRGKTLLVHDEQGFGDTFQFLRLIGAAKERSQARIILQIREEQQSFAKRMTGIDDVIIQGALPPEFDMHCHLMTLPMALGLKMQDLPGEVPYLKTSPERLKKWKKRLKDLPRPLVGLVWAGRPTHLNDANRSLAFAELAPLGDSGVTFVAVQKGDRADDAKTPPAGMNVISLSDEIEDFEDTAAIFQILDLLISVDSSPVHLAGAIGRPAWVMLPFVPDWRWLLDREDTPWYPSVRLFRQPRAGDWHSVIANIRTALLEKFA
ncbi:tetratricopeptide repeat protein [Thalassospira marina]|uniref:Glycosyl transferase family 8 n=1 Tax=Thalassospira marina TaxID=2048283 RepID=A0ABN5FPS0_9PROT|nr:tetratricopeptide repeat protein [Thalassospira marina]AUG55462.1 glycosyl transferase family 8 [Thalassospira marina]